jgi:hypothetical protein
MPQREGNGRAEHRAAEHVAGVVRSNGYPSDGEDCRHGDRYNTHRSVAEQERDRDGEGRGRMIAGKRRIVRGGDEQVRAVRMSRVRARSLPYMHDDLSGAQRQRGAEARRDHAMTGALRPPFPAHQERAREQNDEKDLGLQCEEPQGVLQRVVVVGVAVEELVDLEVDTDSVRRPPARLASRLARPSLGRPVDEVGVVGTLGGAQFGPAARSRGSRRCSPPPSWGSSS